MKSLILILLFSFNANAAWPVKEKKPDATAEQCHKEGKAFVKAKTRKDGIHVRAFCRGHKKAERS